MPLFALQLFTRVSVLAILLFFHVPLHHFLSFFMYLFSSPLLSSCIFLRLSFSPTGVLSPIESYITPYEFARQPKSRTITHLYRLVMNQRTRPKRHRNSGAQKFYMHQERGGQVHEMIFRACTKIVESSNKS